jgi:hypothetical protein
MAGGHAGNDNPNVSRGDIAAAGFFRILGSFTSLPIFLGGEVKVPCRRHLRLGISRTRRPSMVLTSVRDMQVGDCYD